MRIVYWNKLAVSDYLQNIEYLTKYWSDKEAQAFIDEVDEIENILRTGIVDFQNTNKKDVKRCMVCKQISLFYKVIDENTIEFLRFWNNHQEFRSLGV